MTRIKMLRNLVGPGHHGRMAEQAVLLLGRGEVPVPTTTSEVAVPARVDFGRWIADCPFCPGAELVDPDDPRFFCFSCRNASVDGAWSTATFPSEEQRESIEELLDELDDPGDRNWNDAPLEDLKAMVQAILNSRAGPGRP